MELHEAEAYYTNIGFAERVGFGTRPALLVIDCNHGCADPTISPIGIAMEEEIAQIRRLLDLARHSDFPVVYTTVVYSEAQLRDGGWFVKKVPALAALTPDTKEVQIVPALVPQPGELVLEKRFPSGFYGTSLHSYLTRCGVDTVVVTGNSTSGCVRATVVDAVSAGFRVIVPRQCVADRVPLTHMVNLFDIDSKYGDVMEVEDVVAELRRLAGAT
jgi:nicotinamidase-related amidase